MSSTFLTSTSLALPDIYGCSIIRHDLVTTGLAHPLLKHWILLPTMYGYHITGGFTIMAIHCRDSIWSVSQDEHIESNACIHKQMSIFDSKNTMLAMVLCNDHSPLATDQRTVKLHG